MTGNDVGSTDAAPTPPTFGAIYGGGRSGTSWLGTVVSCHPEVTYRFEPLHRRAAEPDVAALRSRLADGSFGPADLDALYHVLLQATAATYRPPYVNDPHGRVPGSLRVPLRAIARLPGGDAAFRRLFTPPAGTTLVYKEVDLANELEALLQAGLPVAYLVRHPAPVVLSRLDGIERGLMNLGGRRRNLDRVIARHPLLAERYGDRLDELDPFEAEALIWRADVDRIVSFVEAAPNASVFFYEELVSDPHGGTQRVLETLGLPMADEVHEFLDVSTEEASLRRRLAYGEIGRDRYFSVFRDPTASRDSWKRKIDADDLARVMAVVADSPVVVAGRERGCWDASSGTNTQ